MKESFKKKWDERGERLGYEKLADSRCPTWRGKGDEEDRECDGMTGLRETRRQWEENGEQQEKIGVGDL